MKEYSDNFGDGEYEVWNPNTREYETYDFVVTKNPVSMISMLNGERYTDYEVILTKASEVTGWSI